jgi:hypothetical protein
MHANRERSHPQLLRAKVSNASAVCFSNIWLQLLQLVPPPCGTCIPPVFAQLLD